MDISRTNEGYTSCGPVVEMSWHRAGVLLLGAQSCLPVPEVPAVVLDGQVSEEEDIVSCLPKLRKTAGSASEMEEAVKPAVKQE
uniref:Uncharacterized protein n=1 Tax=Oryza sativa subsp. japonica TaxID=39947 RepID=Q6Z137_ORYSJ|nr:hypothetical protein [Oryza sativa Japonica Group]BAD31413.1 hypothetical protein [Oryza sativa Japonica Group]